MSKTEVKGLIANEIKKCRKEWDSEEKVDTYITFKRR